MLLKICGKNMSERVDFYNKRDRLTFCRDQLIPLVTRVVDNNIRKPKLIISKGKGNFVTAIDIQIEHQLMEELKALCPDVGFITEESGTYSMPDFNWVIDPIDGTTNFVNGLRFSTSIALKSKRGILIGVVYAPKTGDVFYACKGCGSWLMTKERRR